MSRRRNKREAAGMRPGDLAALADGSLPSERERTVSAHVAESPELGSLVSEQIFAVGLIRGAAPPAPPTLRAVVNSQRTRPSRMTRHRPLLLAAPAVAAATALAFIAFPLGPGNGPATTAQAAGFSFRPATMAAPREDPGRPGRLLESVDGVAYPDWTELHLSGVGQRRDQIGGRQAVTVFYANAAGARVGYTIVAGHPLPVTRAVAEVVRGGVRFDVLSIDSRAIVTWQRGGHTCILASAGVAVDRLVALARWTNSGAGYRVPTRV